jgi:hypothetical protein
MTNDHNQAERAAPDEYENGPEGMPRVKRMPDAVLDCIIDHSLFRYLGGALEGEDRDRLHGLMHDTANEALARISAWPVAPAVGEDGLPPLPAANVFCALTEKGKPLFKKGWMFSPIAQLQAQAPLYTAEQVRQAQREAVEADRRAREPSHVVKLHKFGKRGSKRHEYELSNGSILEMGERDALLSAAMHANSLKAKDALISDLRAQLALQSAPNVGMGWQPIEEAPRDREIWAFNGEQGRMMWSEGDGWALWVWVDELLSDADPSPDQPTHWMPLPSAPQQASQKGEE